MMKTLSWRTAASAVAATALLGATLSACGGGDSGESGTSSSSAGKLTTVKVLLAPVFFQPVYIAQEQGFFKEQGLKIETVEGGAAAQQIPQVVSGKVDIADTGGVSLIAAVSRGIPVQAILGSANIDQGEPTSGLLVKKNSPIHDYLDLQGKTVGLTGLKETTNLATNLAVEKAGGDPSSVKYVAVPLPALNDSVLKGKIDAAYNISSFFADGLGLGLRSIGTPSDELLTGSPAGTWIASKSYINEHKDIIEKFQKAMRKATEYANAHHDAVNKQTIKHTKLDPEYVKSSPYEPLAWKLDRSGVQKTIDAMAKYKFIDKKPSFSDVVWDGAPVKK